MSAASSLLLAMAMAGAAPLPASPEVVVVVTRAELRWEGRLAFALASFRVAQGLPDVPGRLAHRVGFGRWGRVAWTATAWQDEEALEQFLADAPHRRAMRDGASSVRGMASARFRCPAGVAPHDLAEIERWLSGKAPSTCSVLSQRGAP